ncbi:hypothetical protein NM688_g6417 [Phlebia brevispora]|uniref:Uncharacterized protein n=1 Tax=Phlebia brevispora TaxID=194682 RepID=A0ACC1SGI8_9APHY|nr:hypothetical protein NM688_g6417 [Phlebia brevispora]
MLRSRILRQSDPWNTFPRTLGSSDAHAHPSVEPSEDDPLDGPECRGINIRRGQVYTSQPNRWTTRPMYKVLLLILVLSMVSFGLWSRKSRQFFPRLSSAKLNPVVHPSTTQELPPPIHEIKRQALANKPKNAPKARPMVGRKTLLDLVEEEPEHDLSPVKHDIVNLRWPPLVTSVPEIRPSPEVLMSGLTSASVDAQSRAGACT